MGTKHRRFKFIVRNSMDMIGNPFDLDIMVRHLFSGVHDIILPKTPVSSGHCRVFYKKTELFPFFGFQFPALFIPFDERPHLDRRNMAVFNTASQRTYSQVEDFIIRNLQTENRKLAITQ